MAALSCLSDALRIRNTVTQDVNKLILSLVKCNTEAPMNSSKAMPTEPFVKLFLTWPGNWFLTVEQLRLQCLTLLALNVMLRPSDVAPMACTYDHDNNCFQKFIMTTDSVIFKKDGSVNLTFHGIENDTLRDGFEVNLRPGSCVQVDLVVTLCTHIERTKYQWLSSRPLFLVLKPPFRPKSAKTVSTVLMKAITLVGLDNQGFNTKSFRPTGAMTAIQSGLNPDSIRKVGHWKCSETFENHYIHAQPESDFTDIILGLKSNS